jgi:hypothetical protein
MNHIRTPIRAKPATPPTTAPAIVPVEVEDVIFGVGVLVFFEVGDVVDIRRASIC